MNSSVKDHRTDDDQKYDAEYTSGIQEIYRHGTKAITYHPNMDMCIDLAKLDERNALFDRLTYEGQPVYMISVTNNKGAFNDDTRNTYIKLRKNGIDVMLGQWTDICGVTYMDVTMAISGIERSDQ